MLPLSTITYRLLWAALLGGIIGVERSVRKRPRACVPAFASASVRHFSPVSGGIAKLTGDTSTTPHRSNIVQGVGFLARVSLCVNAAASSASPPPPQFSPKPPLAWVQGRPLSSFGDRGAIVILTLTALIYVEDFLKLKCRYMLSA